MKIPVVYSDGLAMNPDEWISLSKPALLMNAVRHEREAWVRTPDFMDSHTLTLAHSKAYVAGVMSGKVLNGFGNTRPDVLKQIMAANSCMVTAARFALQEGVVFAPVSGFHHAGYEDGHGFCTFNGLMVAFEVLLKKGLISNALILDFDGHYGDGTQDIIEKLQRGDRVTHYGRDAPFEDPVKSTEYAVERIYNHKPHLVMLQAGADSLIGDPFGAGYFTGEQWLDRDRQIFKACKETSTPIVWNLAGGYNGEHTVKMHYGTWRTACDIWAKPPLRKSNRSTISEGASVPDSM